MHAVSLACENGMRLSCLHVKYEAKRVYDKWPIKCIKAISHSFHINTVGRMHCSLFFSYHHCTAIMCEFLAKRTTEQKRNMKTK